MTDYKDTKNSIQVKKKKRKKKRTIIIQGTLLSIKNHNEKSTQALNDPHPGVCPGSDCSKSAKCRHLLVWDTVSLTLHKSPIHSLQIHFAYSGNHTGSKRFETESIVFINKNCLCTSLQHTNTSINLAGQLLSSSPGTIIDYQLTNYLKK